MPKLVPGVNDLATLFPDVAAEVDGWDPSSLMPGSNKKMPWKCELGHLWEATVTNRTLQKSGCPYCKNKKVWERGRNLGI